MNAAEEETGEKTAVVDLSKEPIIEFQELRLYYDEHFRPEGEVAGFSEYKQLRASGHWPGQGAIYHDLDARREAGCWNEGFAPSLARYLRERTWKAPVKPAPSRASPGGKPHDLRAVMDKNAETFRRVAERRQAAQARTGGA